MSPPIPPDFWHSLTRATAARIALGRSGVSLPTRELLSFSLDHARARDAVHTALNTPSIAEQAAALGFAPLLVESAAPDRASYLRRPDWGRRLSDASRARLVPNPADLAIIIADGLSATAIERQSIPMLAAFKPWIARQGWSLAPLVIATQARVALGDEIGARLQARLTVMLVGERPGLSSPDSLGIYLTHTPAPGRNDGERNCISNIRPEGLSFDRAAFKLAWLIDQAFQRGQSGVALKDESDLLLVNGQPAATLSSN